MTSGGVRNRSPHVLLGRCPVKQIKYTYLPESSKGLKFKALSYQKQTWGLKFDTLGGPRYIHINIIEVIYHNAHLRIPYLARLVSCWSTPPPESDLIKSCFLVGTLQLDTALSLLPNGALLENPMDSVKG